MFAVFKNDYVFIPVILSETQTVFFGTVRFGGTQFEKHCITESANLHYF
jgi:hypothetical protein